MLDINSKMEKEKDNLYLEDEYVDRKKFNSFFTQIELVRKLKPKTILEIGPGLGHVTSILKLEGFSVKTLDLFSKRKPDYVSSVSKMPVKDSSFDLVLCCEVLEHLPLKSSNNEDLEHALLELRRVTKEYCIISVPYYSLHLAINLKVSGLKNKNITLRLPIPTKKINSKYHYWELGRGCSVKQFKNLIRKAGFHIIEQKNVPLQEYHYFFVLKK